MGCRFPRRHAAFIAILSSNGVQSGRAGREQKVAMGGPSLGRSFLRESIEFFRTTSFKDSPVHACGCWSLGPFTVINYGTAEMIQNYIPNSAISRVFFFRDQHRLIPVSFRICKNADWAKCHLIQQFSGVRNTDNPQVLDSEKFATIRRRRSPVLGLSRIVSHLQYS